MKKSLFTIAFACMAMAGFAQSKSHKVNVTIPTVMDMQMEEGDIDFTYTEANIKNSANPSDKTRELRVRSNVAWAVNVYALTAFKPSNTDNDDLSIGILKLSAPDVTPFSPGVQEISTDPETLEEVIENNATPLVSGAKGGYGLNTNLINYSVDLNGDPNIGADFFKADPDTYSTTLMFTLTSN